MCIFFPPLTGAAALVVFAWIFPAPFQAAAVIPAVPVPWLVHPNRL